ncbi:unnamed protein product [Spirodela intermedia]|uniref:Uncharacterized protein n=1 Tax=Spirodela intermedia TaxID=51605 RepID=A0A7I8IAB8_SPIIN|nr:unnamed protein product [Spirodela intermedia]CAA6654478.1 unnamed protein product [Spirodela intermedia]
MSEWGMYGSRGERKNVKERGENV